MISKRGYQKSGMKVIRLGLIRINVYIVFNYNLSLLAFGLSAEAKLKTICWINNLSTLNSFLYKLMGSPRQCFKKVYCSSICFVLFVYE